MQAMDMEGLYRADTVVSGRLLLSVMESLVADAILVRLVFQIGSHLGGMNVFMDFTGMDQRLSLLDLTRVQEPVAENMDATENGYAEDEDDDGDDSDDQNDDEDEDDDDGMSDEDSDDEVDDSDDDAVAGEDGESDGDDDDDDSDEDDDDDDDEDEDEEEEQEQPPSKKKK